MMRTVMFVVGQGLLGLDHLLGLSSADGCEGISLARFRKVRHLGCSTEQAIVIGRARAAWTTRAQA